MINDQWFSIQTEYAIRITYTHKLIKDFCESGLPYRDNYYRLEHMDVGDSERGVYGLVEDVRVHFLEVIPCGKGYQFYPYVYR